MGKCQFACCVVYLFYDNFIIEKPIANYIMKLNMMPENIKKRIQARDNEEDELSHKKLKIL